MSFQTMIGSVAIRTVDNCKSVIFSMQSCASKLLAAASKEKCGSNLVLHLILQYHAV